MSLINNVLNELEKSKEEKTEPSQSSALDGIISTVKKPQGPFNWKPVFWVIIVMIVLGFIWHYAPKLTKSKIAQAVKTTDKLPTIKLQDVVLENHDNKTIIDFVLTAPIQYSVEHEGQNQLTITLNNTGVLGNLPVALDKSFIAALYTKQNSNNIVSRLTLLPGTKVDEAQLLTKPDRLHVVLTNLQPTAQVISKVAVPPSIEELETGQYQEILQLLAQNKLSQVIQKLRLFIGDFPNNTLARTTLVALLIRDGQIQKADDVLQAGLDKDSDYLPFIKLKAHILIKQNKSSNAIKLLQDHLTIASNDTEYLFLLASLYNDNRSFMAAAAIYNQLAKIQPEKAIWWLGLGNALENADQPNAAVEAYEHANSLSDLSPELSVFLAGKIKK